MYIVTGGSDGLGAALANTIAAKGKKVMSLSRSAPRTQKKRPVGHIPCDLTNEGSIIQAAEAILAMGEPIEGLINCAGVFSEQAVGKLAGRDLALTFTTNIIGPEILVSRLAERLKADKADIVNVASTAGLKGNAGQAGYGASKWAMRGFSQVLREEFPGCRIISFCPGGMETGIFKKAGAAINPEGWMRPGDVANFMWQILCLPKSMEVTEVVINRK